MPPGGRRSLAAVRRSGLVTQAWATDVIRGRVPDTYVLMSRRGRFEGLYRAHAGAVLAYALRRTDSATADDVMADVFLLAWRRLDEVPHDALPFLLGAARRVLANRRRGDTRRAALHERLVEGAAVTPHGQPHGERDDRAMRALAGLAPADREVLLLTAWEGLEPARAARVLGVRPGTLAVRLHRARRRFARMLAAQDAAGADRADSQTATEPV